MASTGNENATVPTIAGSSTDAQVEDFVDVVNDMANGLASVRETIKSLQQQHAAAQLETKNGISLLSLKHHMMLSYIQSLALISSRRAAGDSLTDKTPPAMPFGAPERTARGSGAGDRVDSVIEARVVLEKIKVLEGRMKYQIEKLVRVAEEAPSASVNDPLAFRPNPQALMDQESDSEGEDEGREQTRERNGIYRPPKLAPMPYTEPRAEKDKSRRLPIPNALSSLAHLDPSQPFVESNSGLGATPALMSTRARELQRMTEFEEENMMRLVMKKKDARKRKVDEADIALGGTGAASSRRGRGGGFNDEFSDILKSVGRSRRSAVGDGYEELRERGKKQSALVRSRARSADVDDVGDDGPKARKRSRFEKEVKASKKRSSVKRKS